jgi:hypothetical protein
MNALAGARAQYKGYRDDTRRRRSLTGAFSEELKMKSLNHFSLHAVFSARLGSNASVISELSVALFSIRSIDLDRT